MLNLNDLDAYLTSDASPDECMQLSDLDGFLTGVVCAPTLITPSEWLPVAFGSSLNGIPPQTIELVTLHYNEIVAGLNANQPVVEPIFWSSKKGHVIAMDWCEGFMEAVALRQKTWDAFLETEQGKRWMQPIIAHTFDGDGNSISGRSGQRLEAHLDRMADKITEVVPDIFAYWRNEQCGAVRHA